MPDVVDQIFSERASSFANRTAVSFGGQGLTYSELDTWSGDIAANLCGAGIGQGSLVGVFMERSFEFVAAILAILRAGAAYVPLDPNYPQERIEFLIVDSGISVILVDDAASVCLPNCSAHVMTVRRSHGGAIRHSISRRTASSPNDLAYVMYTSGSTGHPKGVAIPHRGIIRLVCDADYVDIDPTDVFLQASPVSFDASTFEIWGALLNGAKLALLPPGQPSLQSLAETIDREKVTVLFLTTGLFNLIVDERLEALKPVKQLLTGGEIVSMPHVSRVLTGLPSTHLLHVYGPTENTTFTTWHPVPREIPSVGTIPIGRAIRGTTVYVMNEQLKQVPEGEEGELVTGGLGVALSYWNRPELTAERFVSDPFSHEPAARLYRTGDRVRRLPDGTIEFLGRKDDQVKLRGFRIELGEIESALRQHPDVRDCAVMLWSDASGNKSLAAWIVPGTQSAPSRTELQKYIEARLPNHMVPTFWSFLERLPLNPNGKVDRARLPDPIIAGQTVPLEPPRNQLERMLADVWEELLGRHSVGVTASYFDLGASSLLVAQAHERLCRNHGLSIPLTDLFRFPTVRSLAKHLEEQRRPAVASAAPQSADRGNRQRGALNQFRKR